MRYLPQLVDVLAKTKRYDRIAHLYEYQLRSYQKDNAHLMASLAQLYKAMGDYQKARRVAERLLEVDALHQQETNAFLKSLEMTGHTVTTSTPLTTPATTTPQGTK